MSPVLLNRFLLLLAFVGIFISGMLSISKFNNWQPPCGEAQSCLTVTSHSSAFVFGVPVAYYGLAAYLFLAFLAGARAFMGISRTRKLITVGYIVSGLGTLFSLYLTYVSIAQIKTTCSWCLSSAGTMILTLIAHAALAQMSEAELEAAPAPKRQADMLIIGGLILTTIVALGMGTKSIYDSLAKYEQGEKIRIQVQKSKMELVPEGASFYGEKDAPVTIIEFADLQCPVCRQSYPEVKEMVDESKGKLKVVFRHFPLPSHVMSLPAAIMAEMAAEKGKFWDFIGGMYAMDGEAIQTAEPVIKVAESVGLKRADIERRLANEADPALKRVLTDVNFAHQAGLASTPFFFVQTPEGTKVATPATLRNTLKLDDVEKYLK